MTTHRLSRTRIYRIWRGMISRCENAKCEANFARYGARGITVCLRWRKSFSAFMEDMGEPPSPRHSIEREDNNGNYEPGNCVWATPAEQARNRLSTVLITFQGETMCAKDWADRLGIKPATLRFRLRSGWDIDAAMTAPLYDMNRRLRGSAHGMSKLTDAQVQSIRLSGGRQRDLAAQYGVCQSTIGNIRRGDTWKTGRAADADALGKSK